MSLPRWEHFPHGADVGIRGMGPTQDAALSQVALAMTAVIVDPGRVELRTEVRIECEAASPEDLLFDWLDTLVFEMSTRRMLFARFDVHVDKGRLSALAWGEPLDRERHEPSVEIKGPTYTELRCFFDSRAGEWVAQCVVDV